MTVQSERLNLQPLPLNFSLKERVYEALREAIMGMDIYATREEIRLDERQLGQELGVSRTPIREALQRLEQEGFVRILQRRGAFVVRKSKLEMLGTIQVWAALEGMAARQATLHAGDEEIAGLRRMFATFEGDTLRAHIDEYSETNLRFHQQLLQMSHNALLNRLAENLLAHMRSIRRHTIGERDRVERSIIDHMQIIEALEARDTEQAERLARQHTLNLAVHVEAHVHWLD